MINLKIFTPMNNAIKKNCWFLSTIYQHSYASCGNVSLTYKVKNYTTIFKNVCFLKQTLISNNLLSRNISFSKIYFKSKSKGNLNLKPKNFDFRELNELYDVDQLKNECESTVQKMKEEFINNFSLRSAGGSIELIKVKMDGKKYEIQELAQVVRQPKMVVLNVNFPTATPFILQAINKSGLNINPQQDGTSIFLPIPMVTKEYREKLIKGSKAVYIKYRDSIKQGRDKAIKVLKDSDASPDAIRRSIALVEKFSDQYLEIVKNLLDTKQKELSADSK